MTQLKSAKSGDVGDYRIIGLYDGSDCDPTDLSTVTQVQAFVKKLSQTATLEGSVEDAPNGQIRIELGELPDDWLPSGPTKGTWKIEYELTFSDGRVITWPGTDYDEIEVYQDLA